MILENRTIIFDSGQIIKGNSSLQLLVYWNANLKSNAYYQSAGYIEIELNRDDGCIFTVLFFDEIQSQANEIPHFDGLVILDETNTLELNGYLPLSKKHLILKSYNNVLVDANLKFFLVNHHQPTKKK